MNRDDQGIDEDRYVVVPRTLIFLTQKGEDVLLIKGSPDKHLWANKYNGIGGHIERGEDVLLSAQRELAEETGLFIDDLWLSATANIDISEKVGVLIFILRGDYNSGELKSSSEGHIEWIRLDQLYLYPLVEDLKIILPKIMQMKKGDSPLSIRYSYDEKEKLQIFIKDRLIGAINSNTSKK